jgi:predicted TPR repeat methyltransferase
MRNLALNPAVLLSPQAEGYIAYGTTTNRLHELNPTAALLVELCDGSRTSAEVVKIAAPLLPPGSESAVLHWLTHATQEQLLIETTADSQTPRPQELSSEKLVEIASELRDEGKVQAAFLCQQRASQLEPTDTALLRNLGELAHIVGRREAARNAYEAYLELEPDDAEIQHLLTSLRDSEAPVRVPNECIQQLYQRFSSFYESNMVDELGYEGPIHLGKVIDQALGNRTQLSILDLGCGTGLAGRVVADRAVRLVGVDLSAEMIECARSLSIYDELHVAEITDWLNASDEMFDLIIACDTLIYFGDLGQVIAPASRHLSSDGVIAFSVEQAADGTFSLTDNGRYTHHLDHIQATAKGADLETTERATAFLRMEYGEEVTGLYVALQRR